MPVEEVQGNEMHSSLWCSVCLLALSSKSVLWGLPPHSARKVFFAVTDLGNETPSYFYEALPFNSKKFHFP